MNDNPVYVICPCCGSTVVRGKFCVECGFLLENAVETSAPDRQDDKKETAVSQTHAGFFNLSAALAQSGGMMIADPGCPDDPQDEQEDDAADDKGLTLIADYCKRTVATVGGDGYDEIVLYKNEKDGSFQIHTYMSYQYMKKELHRSYAAADGASEAVLALIDELGLDDYEGKRGFGICGGMYICKYLKDGVIHRVTTDNLGTDGPGLLTKVGNLIGSFIGDKITANTEQS